MVCILAIGFLFPYHTYAANTDDILRHNQQMSEKWVNWRPDTWSQDISIKILAIVVSPKSISLTSLKNILSPQIRLYHKK